MLVHVLDYLHLFRMEVEPALFCRDIYLFPFCERQKLIFATEAPYYDVAFPITLEYSSFVVLQELLEIFFITESCIESLIKISC